jgi:hypothetical protein
LSYQFDNQSTAARPKTTTDKRRDGFRQLPDVTGFAPAHPLKRTYDNPNSSARLRAFP